MPVFKKSQGVLPEPYNIEHWVKDTYLHNIQALRKNREDTKKWFDIVNNDIIPSDVEQKLKDAGMPALKLNIVLPKILRIKGAERATRSGFKAIPLKRGSNDTAKAYTKLFEMIRVQSDGHREIAQAFDDAIIGDLGGWLEFVWTVDNDPLGFPIYRRINPFYVVWDIKGKRRDLTDMRQIMKTWWATKADILRDFPEQAKEINAHLEDVEDTNSSWVQDWWERARGSRESIDFEFFDKKENLFRVIECQKREEIIETRLFDPYQQIAVRPENKEELEALKAKNPNFEEVDFRQDKIRIITTVAGDALKLQDRDADIQNGKFSLFPIWGYIFGDQAGGIVKYLEAPQELFWKEVSSALHVVNSAANPTWMIPNESMIPEQIEKLKKWGNRTGYVLEYESIDGQRPHRDVLNVTGFAQLNLAERAKFISDDVTGIGPNAVGQAENSNESGVAVKTRVSETLAMIENLFDNKMSAEIILHNYLIDVIKNKMSGFRVLRYVSSGNDPEELIINMQTVHGIINDMKDGEYGIAIEKGEAQYFRQEKFLKLLSLAKLIGPTPQIIQLMVETFDEIGEREKQAIIAEFREQTIMPELQQMENELRNQSIQENKMLNEGKRSESEAFDKQMDALESLTSTA